MGRNNWWWVDRRSCIVVRQQKAVALGIVQFAVFLALHEAASNESGAKRDRRLPTRQLYDKVYNGASNPPQPATLHMTVRNMNRKLARLDLKICGVNRKQNSFYQIRVMA